MKMISLSICTIVLVMFASTVLGDIPGPKSSPKENKTFNSTLEIIPDVKATSARLQIRKSDLKQLRAALEGPDLNQPLAASITNNSTRTIIAGLLIFLSVSVGGVLLVRSFRTSGPGRGPRTAAAILFVLSAVGATAIISRGNAGPPPGLRWWDVPTALANGESASGPVTVEILPDNQGANATMKLIIPYKKRPVPGNE